MTLLQGLGVASIAATAAFTALVYFGAPDSDGGQSRRESIIESWVNIVIGFSINFVANFAILPLVGAKVSASQNFWMCCIFTAVSVCRSFVIRRWFNASLQRAVRRLAGSADA